MYITNDITFLKDSLSLSLYIYIYIYIYVYIFGSPTYVHVRQEAFFIVHTWCRAEADTRPAATKCLCTVDIPLKKVPQAQDDKPRPAKAGMSLVGRLPEVKGLPLELRHTRPDMCTRKTRPAEVHFGPVG